MKFDKKCGGEMLGVLEPLNITCLFREIERRDWKLKELR